MKRFRRFFAAVLTAVFLTASGMVPDTATILALAAEETVLKDISNLFPAGTELYSDTFPGLVVTYDSKDHYVIKEGRNEINLAVRVTDIKLAKKSLPALTVVFGIKDIPAKEGEIALKKTFVTGITTKHYEELIQKTGDASLINLVKLLTLDDAKEAISTYTRFLVRLSEVATLSQNAANAKENADSEDYEETQDTEYLDDENASASGGSKNTDDGENKKSDDQKEPSEDAPPAAVDYYKRTILLYLDGADLETDGMYGTKSLLDILRTEIPEDIKVYVVTGGSKKWHMDDRDTYQEYAREKLYPGVYEDRLKDDEKAKAAIMADELYSEFSMNISGLQLWEIVGSDTGNRMVNRQTYVGQYITDPKFLTRMIDYGATYAPSDKYDLLLWDHGGGYTGFGYDELLKDYIEKHPNQQGLPETGLSLKNIRDAIAGSDFIKDGNKFDLIGFDACQMGNYEVVTTLKDLTEYYVGSEENEPGTGWDFEAIMSAISADSSISTTKLGEEIVTSFMYRLYNREATLSVIEMGKVAELDSAVSSFADSLLAELEKADSAYLDILEVVGRTPHFATKNGYNTSNYLDIKRFVTPFVSEDSSFSNELKSAAQNVLDKLASCVICNQWQQEGVQNGGLSIYFPLAAYYTTEDAENSHTNSSASDAVYIYDTVDVNEQYKKAVAKFALMNIAGRLVGADWAENNIRDRNDIISKMKSNGMWENDWDYLYMTADVDEQDENDETLKAFQRILDERITKEDIVVTLPERGENEPYTTPAQIKINDVNPVSVGDTINVRVELFDKDSTRLGHLGNTNLYTQSRSSETEDSVTYSLNPFNQVWYLLNGQICSMYITDIYEDSSYKGYIPVCFWADARSASTMDMQDNETRTDYLKRAAKEGKVKTVYLEVYSDEAGETFQVGSYRTVNMQDGGVYAAEIDLDYLENRYYELLGGAEDLYTIQDTPTVFSLGTVYYEGKTELSVSTAYIEGLGNNYYVSDVYGNEYYLTDENLGTGQGLDDFYDTTSTSSGDEGESDSTMSWEKSQVIAEEVRQQAKEAYEAEVAAREELEADGTYGTTSAGPLSAGATMSRSAEAGKALGEDESEKELNEDETGKALLDDEAVSDVKANGLEALDDEMKSSDASDDESSVALAAENAAEESLAVETDVTATAPTKESKITDVAAGNSNATSIPAEVVTTTASKEENSAADASKNAAIVAGVTGIAESTGEVSSAAAADGNAAVVASTPAPVEEKPAPAIAESVEQRPAAVVPVPETAAPVKEENTTTSEDGDNSKGSDDQNPAEIAQPQNDIKESASESTEGNEE